MTASENRQTGPSWPAQMAPRIRGVQQMATLSREISLDTPAEKVWPAIRDFGQVHARVAPGFLTALEMDKGDRIVTFFNGMVARERLVTTDDRTRRLVYAVVEGRASHYNAAVQVIPEGAGCRIVWTIDLLPDELAPAIGAMMDQATGIMKKTLEA
jgi:carbon monoxide dehydrogenase subunit G